MLAAYTLFHVALSLIGIGTGFVVIGGMIAGRQRNPWTEVFLATTVLTSVTGFGFPIERFTPGLAIGILSLLVLTVTLYALYAKHLAGRWRLAYVVTAVVAQYLNFFVLIVQSFMKVPALRELAPTQNEPPFAIAQGVALLAFIALGVLAALRFRAAPPPAS